MLGPIDNNGGIHSKPMIHEYDDENMHMHTVFLCAEIHREAIIIIEITKLTQ